MNHPVWGSTSPLTATSHLNEWPWSRKHLCSSGTRGSRWAASKVNSLTRSTTIREQSYLLIETIRNEIGRDCRFTRVLPRRSCNLSFALQELWVKLKSASSNGKRRREIHAAGNQACRKGGR